MGLGVEDPPGIRQAQRRQQQRLGKVPLEARRRSGPPRGEQQDQLLRLQPPGGEGERVQGGMVEPLRVVGDYQQRAVLR